MKKLILSIIAVCATFVSFSQQSFNLNVTREGNFLGGLSPLTLYYLGDEKARIKNKSEFTLTETLPSDSIIELKFRNGIRRPTKYFLYPNATLDYHLQTKISMGSVKIRDLSVYPEGSTAGYAQQQKMLPKGVSVNKKTLGISYINEKTLSSDEIRKQWARQGGKMVGRSLSYLFTFARSVVKTSNLTTTTTIVGGGWTYTQNYYTLKIPEYKTGIASWNSLVYGLGVAANLHMAGITLDPAPSKDYETFGGGSFVFMINGNFGYTVGLGKFRTEANYKGLALELTYKPSLIASAAEGYTATDINLKGFGIDITRSSFSAYANRIAPKAKSKFSLLLLPPLKNTPFMVSFGYGLIWYR